MSKMKLALDVVQDLRNLADSMEALVRAAESGGGLPEKQDPAPMPEAKPNTVPTLVELRAYVAERSTPENRAKIKDILTKYGVRKLTELQEGQYAAVMNEVSAL